MNLRMSGLLRGLVCTAGLLAAPGHAGAVPVTLTGTVTAGQASYASAALVPFGAIEYTAIDGVKYTGAPLWSLLGSRFVLPQFPPPPPQPPVSTNNLILSSYVMATGADGRMSLISAGEINPDFGGTGAVPYLVAYLANGVPLDTPRLIIPDDPTGTRNITDLVNLDLRRVDRPLKGPGGQSTEFDLSGTSKTVTYDLKGLKGLPQTTIPNVTFNQGNSPSPGSPFTFKGVDLWGLLTSVGVGSVGDILTSYFLATGSDGFEVLYSLAELDPAFHPNGDIRDLAAYEVARTVSGVLGPLEGLGSAGFARIVKPGDLKGGRYVSNLTDLQIVDTVVPVPATLALLALGLFGMLPMVCRWRGSEERNSR